MTGASNQGRPGGFRLGESGTLGPVFRTAAHNVSTCSFSVIGRRRAPAEVPSVALPRRLCYPCQARRTTVRHPNVLHGKQRTLCSPQLGLRAPRKSASRASFRHAGMGTSSRPISIRHPAAPNHPERGRMSACRWGTIHRGTSFTVSSMNHLRHAPQTLTKCGERLNMPAGRRPKLTSIIGVSQFGQIIGAARRHALLSAAHGMGWSSTPPQAIPPHVLGAARPSSGSRSTRLAHLLWNGRGGKWARRRLPKRQSSPRSVASPNFLRSRRTTATSGRASPYADQEGVPFVAPLSPVPRRGYPRRALRANLSWG